MGRQISKTTLADPLIGRQISKTTLADPLIGRQILKTTLADPLIGHRILKTTLADPPMGHFDHISTKNIHHLEMNERAKICIFIMTISSLADFYFFIRKIYQWIRRSHF